MRKLLILIVALGIPLAVAAVASGEPRDSVSRLFPIYDNGGKPDLTVDPKRFTSQMEIVDRVFDPTSCELVEGSVNAAGIRRILRFDVVLINGGDGHITIGSPTDPNGPYYSIFEFSPCHGHYHISGFADYSLRNTDGTVAAQGHKQAFCFIDTFKYSNDLKKQYADCSNQGITSGWGDWYYKQLSGQWIDITGVPAGDYIVRVRINAAGTFDEGTNRYPDVIEAPVHIPDPRNKVTVDTSPLVYGA
jgi:Lysyl oxidase